jgi:mannose-6-phosphate isomerase-like protein (cupin superfamily)
MTYGAVPFVLTLALASPAVAQTPKRGATPAAPATAAVIVTVTDGKGVPLEGVTVRVTGAVDREGETTNDGMLRLQGLRPGTYRFRFIRPGSVTLERDVVVPPGQRTMDQNVTLSAADRTVAPTPPAPTPTETAKPVKPQPLPPPGKAVSVSLPAYIEQNFITGTQPQKVSNVACSGVVESVLWQIRDPWQNRQHPNTDAMLYVVGGEGTARMNNRDVPLAAGTFVSVPRGTTYGLTRRGRNPLIILATLGGEGCTP